MHTHTHTHVHTHHGQSVIHASTSMLCYFNLFYFLIVDPHTNIVLAVILFITCFSFVFLLEPYHCLNCLVYQCAHLCMHTHTHHTQALAIHLQLRSHVYCLCKFEFPCSGNYQQVFLLPFALLNIMHAHAHTHMHTNQPAHARTFMYTHRSHASITNVCICTHKNGFGSHPSQHTHAHTHTHIHRTGLCFV